MPSELVSGPDLGGGFLFQLTLDREDARASHTIHAQNGGMDAGGPPKGSPVPLGFLLTPEACQFGGPRCWHRPFALGLPDALRVRVAYNRMRFMMAVMIDQLYEGVPVPFESTLGEFIDRIAPEIVGVGGSWWVEGATGAWLQGVEVRPMSIEVRSTGGGAERFASIWSEYLTEPVGWTELPGLGTVLGAAAFVGTVRTGTRVRVYAPGPSSSLFPVEGPRVEDPLSFASWRGSEIPVASRELLFVEAVATGSEAVASALGRDFEERKPDRERLLQLLDRADLDRGVRERIRSTVGV